jgi:hypothetical protein
MGRLWGVIDREPWMINPARLGILGTFNPRGRPGKGRRFTFHGAFKSKEEAKRREKQTPHAFILDRGGEHYVLTPRKRNPKRSKRTMASSAMRRRMAYVRSFQRNRRHRKTHYRMNRRRRVYAMNRRRYRRNPYPMGGTVAALANPRRRRYRRNRRHVYMYNRRRHYRRNPGFYSGSYFGLPSLQTVAWSVIGFSGTAAIQSMLWGTGGGGTGLLPASWTVASDGTTSKIVKYGVLLGSVALVHTLIRMFRPAQAQVATVGSGLYAASQIIHDLIPGVVPGLQAYTPLHAYTPLRAYSRWGSHGLASQNIGASNLPVGWNPNGAMDILAQRFRRFN